ncbi:MAG: GWxTD domain-containing protein, partial [bacterium]
MKVWTLYPFTVFFLLQFLPIFAQSQQDHAIADSLFTVGKNLLALGDKEGATSAFNKALAKNKTLLNARIELGKMAIAEEKWSKAGQQFDAILELDPENLAAHYYRAICHREYGKFRQLLARVLDWPKAEKHFKQVMARDSLYQDILYQFGLLQRYRGKYIEAINLCYDQIRLRPELLQPKISMYQFYRYFIRHKNDKEVLVWLKAQSWDQAQYFIGESLRRVGKLSEGDSVFQALLTAEPSMSKQPIFLSLVRIHYKQGNRPLAEKYFWLAVDSIHTQLDAELVFEDIKYIVTDEELNTFRALKDNAAKIKFFHTFWTRRDPTPAATVNVRLAEHYRRLNYVEEYYEYDGFRTYFNSSDPLNYFQFPQSYALNHEFDDRGLVYLRHGPPDDQIVTVGISSGPAPSNESWKYWQRDEEPELTFHFLKPADVWRLSPTLPANPEIYTDRFHWNSIYYRYMNALSSGERY